MKAIAIGESLETLSIAELEARIAALEARPGIGSTFFFKNVGALAGASIDHNHSQVLGLPELPPRLARMVVGAAREGAGETAAPVVQRDIARDQAERAGLSLLEAKLADLNFARAADRPLDRRLGRRLQERERNRAGLKAPDDIAGETGDDGEQRPCDLKCDEPDASGGSSSFRPRLRQLATPARYSAVPLGSPHGMPQGARR